MTRKYSKAFNAIKKSTTTVEPPLGKPPMPSDVILPQSEEDLQITPNVTTTVLVLGEGDKVTPVTIRVGSIMVAESCNYGINISPADALTSGVIRHTLLMEILQLAMTSTKDTLLAVDDTQMVQDIYLQTATGFGHLSIPSLPTPESVTLRLLKFSMTE